MKAVVDDTLRVLLDKPVRCEDCRHDSFETPFGTVCEFHKWNEDMHCKDWEPNFWYRIKRFFR